MIQSLENNLAFWQQIRHVGETILIGGLVSELLILAFIERLESKLPPRALDETRKLISTAVATLLILVGVGIENFASGRADEVVRRMRAPRLLTSEQQQDLYEKTKQFSGQRLDVFASRNDREAFTLAIQIEAILASQSHWQVVPFQPIIGSPIPGMSLEVDPKNLTALSAAVALSKALDSYGFLILGPTHNLPHGVPHFASPGTAPNAPLRLSINQKE